MDTQTPMASRAARRRGLAGRGSVLFPAEQKPYAEPQVPRSSKNWCRTGSRTPCRSHETTRARHERRPPRGDRQGIFNFVPCTEASPFGLIRCFLLQDGDPRGGRGCKTAVAKEQQPTHEERRSEACHDPVSQLWEGYAPVSLFLGPFGAVCGASLRTDRVSDQGT